MNARKLKRVIMILLVLITAQTVLADSARSTVRQANKLYNKGQFNEAIKQYDQALTDQPQVLEPKFNKADCYFQLDDLAKAINLYNEVAADSKDMKLVARAKYNLGNCYFKRGSKQKDSDLQKALEDMQTSIICWRSALEIDPKNDKAAKNIEVARLTIKDIVDQLNKQKEQQKRQTEKQKQLQEQLKELAEKQKSLANQIQGTKEQEEKGQINQQDATNNYKKEAQEQSQLKEEAEKTSQQMQQQQDPNTPLPPQMQQAVEELNQAVDKQSDAEAKLKASEGAAAKKSQDEAAEHLENAAKVLSDENQQNQQQQQQTQQPQELNQSGQQQQRSQQEQKASVAPDATAQEILDKEQQEKKQRQVFQRADYQKVDKDW